MANYTFPIGKYLVDLAGVQGFSQTSNGNHQFFMKFTPVYVWDNGRAEWVECDQVDRTWYRVITEKSAQYAAEDFRALGFTGDRFSLLDPRHPQKHIFTGQIEMTCSHDQYNGKTSEKWNVVRAGGAFEEKVCDPAAIKKLDMLFGAAMKAAPPAAPAPAAVKPTPARPLVSQPRSAQPAPAAAATAAGVADPNEITDDDLPF